MSPESWTWTDETADRGVSYLYTIKPYYEFYSDDGSSVWSGVLGEVISGEITAPAHRVRIYGRASNVSHRMPHPEQPGTPTNLVASQPNSGDCTGDCVRLTWDAPDNATKYMVFRTGQRTRETWVDYGLTYPQQRFYPADPDLTVTEWEDTSAEPGVSYGYRVAAFNEDGLRSAGDAVVGFETPGGTTVPNRVRDLSASATRSSTTSASVVLSWTAPVGLSSVTGYEVQYRLDIPERGEWDDDWKTLRTEAANAVSSTHTIALEKYYPQGGTTPPFEYVPTADKSTLRLNDTDTENDLILPFGITYEYRVRGVNGANKGLPADTSVRIPNQDGLPPVVIIRLAISNGCAIWSTRLMRTATSRTATGSCMHRRRADSTRRRWCETTFHTSADRRPLRTASTVSPRVIHGRTGRGFQSHRRDRGTSPRTGLLYRHTTVTGSVRETARPAAGPTAVRKS